LQTVTGTDMHFSLQILIRKLALGLSACALSALTTLAVAQESDLPDIGNPAGTILSMDDEYRIGLYIMRELRDENQIIEDPEVTEYVQSIGSRLAAQAPDADRHFTYFVVRDSAINAFALPGGFIGVNYGTILASDSESELAGVLAHETAHVVQRHIARAIQAQSKQSLTTAAAILAAILIGVAGGGGQAVEGGIAAAEGMAVQQQINFTRSEEFEADRVGMGFLSRAGFDPRGMPDFFEVLQRRYGFTEARIPKFLLDHPVTSERVAEARGRAAQLERPKKLVDSVSYTLVRERLRVLTASQDTDLKAYYGKRLETRNPPLSDQYGQALALLERGHPTEAAEILEPLVSQHEGVILLHAALGQAQVASGQIQDGLTTFEHAEALFPRNVPLTIRYSEALMKAGQAKLAHNLLLDLFNNVEPTPAEIRLTALAASAAGDTGDAYYYMSEYHISSGNLPLASQQLQLALAAPNLTLIQRERFQARLDEIRDVLANERRAQREQQAQDGSGGGRRGGGR
jgi:predicted Zn-dependent protease